MYRSTKTYGHERGFSCAFRQWRADSHCKLLHGYALSIHVEFEAEKLDDRNWVVDFGGLSDFEKNLQYFFDHTLLVSRDDPEKMTFVGLDRVGLAKVRIVKDTGCEAFAELVTMLAQEHLEAMGMTDRVRVAMVQIKEHGANGASFIPGE